MSIDAARRILILSSLLITGAQMVFLLIAPTLGYPLRSPQNLQLLQIVSPVFLGYLGAAAHFIFRGSKPSVSAQEQFLGLLVIGPLAIYSIVLVGLLGAFGYSNRRGVPVGDGMSLDDLQTSLSIALGVLAATTGVVTGYLFVNRRR